jgi:hypothetical protein
VLFPLVRAGHIPDILNSGIEDHENLGVLEFMNRLCALSRFNLQTPGNRFRTVSWIDCACSGGCFRPAWENIWYVILARNSIEFHRRRSCLSKGNFRVADKPGVNMLRYDLGAMLWLWCWRCKAEMPMLDEAEFKAVIQGFYPHDLERHKLRWPEVRAEFTRITGYVETNPSAIWHHRISLYGPPCHRCGKPLRSPKAKLCGSCMAPRAQS